MHLEILTNTRIELQTQGGGEAGGGGNREETKRDYFFHVIFFYLFIMAIRGSRLNPCVDQNKNNNNNMFYF